MRLLASMILVAAFAIAGCDAGDVAEDVSGFHTLDIKSIYAPKRYCEEVKEERPDEGLNAEVSYRVVCLKDRQWARNLLRACQADPKSVKQQYWIYNPATEKSGYVTCDNLEELGAF